MDYAKGCSTRDAECASRTGSRLVELVVPCSGGSSLSGVILSENLKHVDLWACLLLLPTIKKKKNNKTQPLVTEQAIRE